MSATTDRVPQHAGRPGPAEQLTDVVDFHVHSSPDVFPRRISGIDAALAAKQAGMGGLVLKSHSTDTAARAETARLASGLPVFGGVSLNSPVGGLNPYAVAETVRQGGRVIWMPTITARHFIGLSHFVPMLRAGIPPGIRGITVTRADGRLKSAVLRILDLIAEHDLVLCSGHISPDETALLFERAHELGIRRLVVTHPNAPFVGMSADYMAALAALGAYMEWTPQQNMAERAAAIRAVGVEHGFVSTDGGSTAVPLPVHGMAEYIAGLRNEGFSDAELHHMTVSVPSHLLGIDGWSERPSLRGHQASTAAQGRPDGGPGR